MLERKKSLQALHENALVFLDILQDLDRILATNKNFLLGPWLESAKALATNSRERKLYEFNARNQITLWGPDGQILDYGGWKKLKDNLRLNNIWVTIQGNSGLG